MLALKAFTSVSVLNRNNINSLEHVLGYLQSQNCDTSKYQLEKSDWNNLEEEKQSLKVPNHVFHKHIKPKKRHELFRLGQTCSLVSAATNCQTVLDIGGGMGHLSRLLNFGYGLNVICLECNENLGEQAARLDKQLAETCAKLGVAIEKAFPSHVTAMISPDTKNLDELFDRHPSIQLDHNYGLIGLHTCGDLGPTMIRLFSRVPEIRFILAVGCCYMKMDLTR